MAAMRTDTVGRSGEITLFAWLQSQDLFESDEFNAYRLESRLSDLELIRNRIFEKTTSLSVAELITCSERRASKE